MGNRLLIAPKNHFEEIGSKLRSYRLKKGFSAHELGLKTKRTGGEIEEYEQGHSLSIKNVWEVCVALDVDIRDLSIKSSVVTDSNAFEGMSLKEYLSAVGLHLKYRRSLMKVSAKEMASRIGKSSATVFGYENGQGLTLEILWKMSEVLGIDIFQTVVASLTKTSKGIALQELHACLLSPKVSINEVSALIKIYSRTPSFNTPLIDEVSEPVELPDPVLIGKFIKEKRISILRITQQELAERLGWRGKSTVCKYEQGKGLSLAAIISLAKALNISASEIVLNGLKNPKTAAKRRLINVISQSEMDDETIENITAWIVQKAA